MSSNHHTSGKSLANAPGRRGFTLMEVVIAASMLAMLLAASVQMLRAISLHQRATERRAVALEGVQAVADQVANIPWKQLTAENAQKVTLPKPLDEFLPGAKLSVSLDEAKTPVESKRVHIDLTWNGPDGQPVAPIQLTSWAFPERSLTE
jgi:prepilin-type N-terminal cleavage/methylation domain-containing protein